jgi:hypothetical protein
MAYAASAGRRPGAAIHELGVPRRVIARYGTGVMVARLAKISP